MPRKKAAPNRNVRIADQIQRDLSELIAREVKDPRIGLVTLQSVELTPDYAHAKIFFTTLTGDSAETQLALNHAAGHLHNLLFRRLHIHTVPALHFVFDQTVERAVEMSRLIDHANSTRAKDDEAANDVADKADNDVADDVTDKADHDGADDAGSDDARRTPAR
jgi:ribosome-binding factor A